MQEKRDGNELRPISHFYVKKTTLGPSVQCHNLYGSLYHQKLVNTALDIYNKKKGERHRGSAGECTSKDAVACIAQLIRFFMVKSAHLNLIP
jgi:hypothetical protein